MRLIISVLLSSFVFYAGMTGFGEGFAANSTVIKLVTLFTIMGIMVFGFGPYRDK